MIHPYWQPAGKNLESQCRMFRTLLVTRSLDGHRREYVDQFRAIFSDKGLEVDVVSQGLGALGVGDPVLFLMVEEDLFAYVGVSMLRGLTGRRTVGLLFRGQEAACGRALKLRVKRILLRMLKAVRGVTTLSIVPFDACPALAMVADDCIDDPQPWDLLDLKPPRTPLSEEVEQQAGNRKVVVSLGLQNPGKGVGFFMQAWQAEADLREDWLFVAAGRVSSDLAAEADSFREAGGLVVDRFITDAELRSLYGVATVIWGVYSPEYDQASGIFGRAVQFNRPIIVRKGSAVERIAAGVSARAASIEFGRSERLAEVLSNASALDGGRASPALMMRARSLKKIFDAMGIGQ